MHTQSLPLIRPFGLTILLCACAASTLAHAAELDEFRVKRKEVFAFTAEPTVTRQADAVAIAFEAKDFCDATVAIENADGKIIRHLACGVLGDKAPAPFKKGSLKQELVWDGKDDAGRYIDTQRDCVVRVSLGLKPRFERTLFWSPYKRLGFKYPVLAAGPEGVYVGESDGVDHIRLFDHNGTYLRSVYPFPRASLDKIQGLPKHNFAIDNQERPLKQGYVQGTLLTIGSDEYNHDAISALAATQGKLAATMLKLDRLTPEGTSGGLNLTGPKTSLPIARDAGGFGHPEDNVTPRSAAFSPDGKYVYLAGYQFGGWRQRSWLNVVMRAEYGTDADPSVFLGTLEPGETNGTGDPGKFRVVSSVDCDAQGRVYVGDYMNNRVQIFSADGKFLKAIETTHPAQVCVHKKTGEVFVFSWLLVNRLVTNGEERFPPKLSHFGAFDDPKKIAEYDLPMEGYNPTAAWNFIGGAEHRMTLDSWAEKPTFWLVNGNAGGITQSDDGSFRELIDGWEKGGVQIFEEAGGKLVPKKRFVDEAKKDAARIKPPILWRQRLYVNPKNGHVYVAEGDCGVMKAVNQLIEIDPETGKQNFVELPLGAEDLCFDQEGLAYLRTDTVVARFNADTWKEVAWDYGEDFDQHSYGMGARGAKLVCALQTPGHRSFNFWQLGGIAISPKGHLIVTTCNGAYLGDKPGWQRGEAHFNYEGKAYRPALYPGRQCWGEIHIFDRKGKMLLEDAVPGMGHLNGIGIDADDNVYMLSAAKRLIEGKPFDQKLPRDASGTVLKVPAGKAKVLSDGSNMVPVPMDETTKPKRGMDLTGYTTGWVENAEWFYGNAGFSTPGACICWNCRFSLDYFRRSFVPEPLTFSVAILDASGNVIERIGRYGNVEDGKPLVEAGGPKETHAIGGDEIALAHACYVAAHTDRRLFIADAGNARVLSIKLEYHTEKKLPLKDLP